MCERNKKEGRREEYEKGLEVADVREKENKTVRASGTTSKSTKSEKTLRMKIKKGHGLDPHTSKRQKQQWSPY
jgi:hypothetical protein